MHKPCYNSSQVTMLAILTFLSEGVENHRKIGLIIRNSTTDSTVYVDGVAHGDGLTSLQYREKDGGETIGKRTEIEAPEFIQVERRGGEFILRVSKDEQPLTEVGRVSLNMESTVLAGMFISSHNADVVEEAVFWNVRNRETGRK